MITDRVTRCPKCGVQRTLAKSTYRHKVNRTKICVTCTARQNLLHVKHPGIYPRKSLEERFWAKVKKIDTCWLWTGFTNKVTGYGQIQIDGRPELVHRVSYEWGKGSIPEGMELDHLCRNRICVNPEHLQSVLHRENVLRGINACATNAKVTHCPQGHAYDLFNTYHRPDGGRDCKLCRVRRFREFKARQEVEA